MSSETDPLLPRQNGANRFTFDPDELAQLVDPKDPRKLHDMGGVEAVAKGLDVKLDVGLSSDEDLGTSKESDGGPFSARRGHFGKNVLPEVEQRSLMSLVWEAYQDKTLIMLSIAAVVSLIFGISEDFSPSHPADEPRVGWVEGAAILAAVAAVVFTNAINDYQKEKQFRKLNAKKEDRVVKLIRSGREQQINVHEINVGDVMLLEPGDIVAVDGIYISGHNLVCDESSATGESDAIKKTTLENGGDPFVLSGSKVLEGVAKVVVIAVGEKSYFGKTMMGLRGNENDETPLQIKLDMLAEQIAKLGISAAILMLITLTIKFFVKAAISNDFPDGEEIFSTLVSIIIQAITIIVVAVPEGLPMAVTLALAYATTQMLKDNNLVRVLAACETMGNATAVCSDKTGTLTQNRMTVVQGSIGQKELTSQNEVQQWKKSVNKETYEIFMESVCINSTAFEGPDENGKLDFIGSKTECALLGLAKACGENYADIRSAATIELVYPFASQKKTMTTVVKINKPDAGYRVHVKGASEIVLSHCTHYLDVAGKVQPLDDETKKQFDITISRYADQALRTICLGYRDVSEAVFDEFVEEEPPNEKLVCLGIVGIQDPLRPGVIESVEAFRKAGVFVRMITGDNIQTAKAIALNAHILTAGGVATTGPEFRNLSREKQMELVPRLQVLARSSPTDKTIVVSCLKDLGEVVAVTGDGTNDGPALKLADVGFSMGIAGTEVAKEASSIILMDDNFNSIVKALKWGRAVNDSVRKFLQFQLTVNITAVVLSFTSAVISDDNESVLTTVQLLWVNLIMDTLAALALATEPPREELLDRFPTSKTASLINFRMWKMILGQAFFQIMVNLTLINLAPAVFHLSDSEHDKDVLRSIVFNTFVFLQVFNELNCRRIDDDLNVFTNIFQNQIFIIVQVIVIVGQFFIIEFGGVAFGTAPLTWYQWLATVLIGSLSLPIGVVIRLLPNFLVPESILNEDHKPVVSYSQMQWESVRSKMSLFRALRNDHRRNSVSRPARRQSEPGHARSESEPLGTNARRFATLAEHAMAAKRAAGNA